MRKGVKMGNLKEVNEEISRLNDEIKKIKAKNIKNFSTKDLHYELIKESYDRLSKYTGGYVNGKTRILWNITSKYKI